MSAHGIHRHPTRALMVLSAACLIFALAQMMLIPALPALIAGLDTNENDVAWTITGYLLTAAVAIPIFGRLGDMFGKRRMVVIAMAAFATGALISATSTALWMIIIGRALAGVGGGVFPLSFSMVRELVPAERVPRAIGFVAATVVTGNAAGLLLAGAIIDHLSWRWIFWVTAVLGAGATVALRFLVPESRVKSGGRVDIRGALVLAIGLMMPLLAISRAVVWGWTSPRTIGLIAAGLVVLACWVRLELHTDQPLANIRSLRSPPVLVTNVAALFPSFALQTMIILVSLLAQAPTSTGYGLGLSAIGAGLMLAPGALLSSLAGPTAGALGIRVGSKYPFAGGALLGAIGLAIAAFRHDTEVELIAVAALLFFGFGLSFASQPNLIIQAVPPAITGESLAFNGVVTRVSASLGVQVTASIVASSALAGSATPTNQGFQTAFLVAAVLCLIGTVIALCIPEPRRGYRLPLDAATRAVPARAS